MNGQVRAMLAAFQMPPELRDEAMRWLVSLTEEQHAEFRRMHRLMMWALEALTAGKRDDAKIFFAAADEIKERLVPQSLRDQMQAHVEGAFGRRPQ